MMIGNAIRVTGAWVLGGAWFVLPGPAEGAWVPDNEASSVVVIYNQAMTGSRDVAMHYAGRREVPTNQIFGFDLPVSEEMTRRQYLDRLQTPLLHRLRTEGLFVFDSGQEGRGFGRLRETSVRYLAVCYGVPIKILPDPDHVEELNSQLPPLLRKNEAAVDSQLAILPTAAQQPVAWLGFAANPAFGTTNRLALHPTNGVLMVSRLDGPTADIARRLVDRAMEAETNGLWGRAYFDWRSIDNQALQLGDQWLQQAELICRQYGFETEVDTNASTFPEGYPLSHVAIYAGWYGVNADGPFLRPQVEFMPGAFAYHLYSFSAGTLRSKDANWVGPLLDRGASATIGSVYEPYLNFTPDLPVFFSRWIFFQFTFAEAAWSSLRGLSWQNLVVGDPLYRPFKFLGKERRIDLERRQSELVQWSYLQAVNRNLVMQFPVDDTIRYLEQQPVTKTSSILTEKLGDLYLSQNKFSFAIYSYEDALKRRPSAQQRIRLLKRLAHLRSYYGTDEKALAYYEQLLREFPEYLKYRDIHEKMLSLARNLGDRSKMEALQKTIDQLTRN